MYLYKCMHISMCAYYGERICKFQFELLVIKFLLIANCKTFLLRIFAGCATVFVLVKLPHLICKSLYYYCIKLLFILLFFVCLLSLRLQTIKYTYSFLWVIIKNFSSKYILCRIYRYNNIFVRKIN